MKDLKDELIEKQKELIEYCSLQFQYGQDNDCEDVWNRYIDEIAALEKQIEEQESKSELCLNCKEPIGRCACMRNLCIKCGKPVGNITFTVCDDCWDKKVLKIERKNK